MLLPEKCRTSGVAGVMETTVVQTILTTLMVGEKNHGCYE